MVSNGVLDPLYIEIIKSNDSNYRYKLLNDAAVVDLAAFLYNNSEFIVFAANILEECTNVSNLSNVLSNFFEENYGDDLTDEQRDKNNKFIDLTCTFYSDCSGEGKKLSDYRGALLERVTLLFILERYMYFEDIYLPIDKELLNCGCDMDIDCDINICHAGWETDNPIDIAGWNQNTLMGEGYECKIKITSMKQSDDDILYKLYEICNSSPHIEKFNVGVVTFSSIEGYEFYFKFLNDNDRSTSEVKVYGRSNFTDLKNVF